MKGGCVISQLAVCLFSFQALTLICVIKSHGNTSIYTNIIELQLLHHIHVLLPTYSLLLF